VVVETRTPAMLAQEPLWPEEEALLGPRASPKRRQDFAAGRACARRALVQLGAPAGALLSGSNRQPLWPPGIVGSITHCSGYCAAAVAWATRVWAIGIDAEVNVALPVGVVAQVCSPAEQDWVRLAPQSGIPWATVIFCAKESIYKAWFPLTGRWLGFEDVKVTVDPHAGAFTAAAVSEAAVAPGIWPARVHGRFLVTRDLVLSAVFLPPPGG
jgi:enterobactin synthetase component D / holo-[acyl-carrier protein] synthase